jgi:type IV pilus assembly protein PilW
MGRKYQRGMNLIEILITMSLSLILMAGVLHIMSSSKRTYGLQGELAGLQENARFLIEDINYTLRMGGYFGCSGSPPTGISRAIFTGSSDGQQPEVKMRVATKDAQKNYVLSDKRLAKAVPESDILVISQLGEQIRLPDWTPATISAEFSKTTNQFLFNAAELNISPTQVKSVVITDCNGSDTYQVKSVNLGASTIVLNQTLLRPYLWPVEVFASTQFPVQPITYEVGALDKNGDGDAEGSEDGFGLFKNGILLIEGVENLQIRYGIDTDGEGTEGYGAANRYDSLPNGKVVSVRVTLLMRTPNRRYELTEAQNTDFQLDSDLVYNPSNRGFEVGYRHRLFSSIVQVRNSLR